MSNQLTINQIECLHRKVNSPTYGIGRVCSIVYAGTTGEMTELSAYFKDIDMIVRFSPRDLAVLGDKVSLQIHHVKNSTNN